MKDEWTYAVRPINLALVCSFNIKKQTPIKIAQLIKVLCKTH